MQFSKAIAETRAFFRADPSTLPPRKRHLRTVCEVVGILILVGLVRYFLVSPFIVVGESMSPGYENGQYLVVDETASWRNAWTRGDVVIIRYPLDTSKHFIKRLIGFPGDTIHIRGSTVTIAPAQGGDPIVLDEPYVVFPSENDDIDRTLGPDEFFVMGDNRANSSDSRIWGPVPRDDMSGIVLVRLFPFSSIAWRPVFPARTTP